MGWRHLIPLNLICLNILVGILLVFGLLGSIAVVCAGILESLSPGCIAGWFKTNFVFLGDVDLMLGLWHWLHTPAEIAHDWLIARMPGDVPGLILVAIFPALALTQNLFLGYLVGSVLDIPWSKWFHRQTEEEITEDELHRDLRIAKRLAERLEADEEKKKALREKVEKMKKNAQGRSGGDGEDDEVEATA